MNGITLAILIVATLSLIGCGKSLKLENVELVGGGGSVHYTAVESGTVYLVDMRRKELVASRRLRPGDKYWTNVDALRTEGVKVDKRGRDLRLYFQPDSANPMETRDVVVKR